MKCPNKSHADWKAIESVYGEDAAYLAYLRNGEDIPSITGAKYLLGINEDGESASLMTRELVSEFTGFSDPATAKAATEHLLRRYSNVQFFSSEEAFENFVRTNFLREVHVGAEDVGLAFKNAVFIKVGDYRQDRLLHELGHIYYDSLADDNRSKVELRALFAGDTQRPVAEVDEDIVCAIGQLAHSHAEQFFAPDFFGKLVNAVRRFWVQVRLTVGMYDKDDLLMDLADQLYNNRADIGSEVFGSDVLRHLLIPADGNVVGKDYDEYGRNNLLLDKKLSSPSSIIKALFGRPDMDIIEGVQEQQLVEAVRGSYIGEAGGRVQSSEVRLKTFMRHRYYGLNDKMGTAIHAALAYTFADAQSPGFEAVEDEFEKAKALLGDSFDKVLGVTMEVKELLTKRYGSKAKFHPEVALASASKGLFGRLDLIVELPNGHFAVVDFKTVNESLFDKNGFSKNYVKVHGIGHLPFMKEVADAVTNTQLYKLYKSLSGLPSSKFRHHQLQGLIYKTLVEDQKVKGSKVAPIVDEVVILPLVKSMVPNVTLKPTVNGITDFDPETSGWQLSNLSIDKDVVVTYSLKAKGPSVPNTSSLIREKNIQDKMLMLIDQVKLVELSHHSPIIEESIRRASKRADAVSIRMAYDAVSYVTMATGKPLNELTSRDVQHLFGTGIANMYEKAMSFILQEAEKAKVELPENFMNFLKFEQIYWAAKKEFVPDFSDVMNGSLTRTKDHSDPSMRFSNVEVGTETVWNDNSKKKAFNSQVHARKLIRLTLNGGAQKILFREYGLVEASADENGKLKVGMSIMLPPALTVKEDKKNGMDYTVRVGKIVKLYNKALSVEVEEDDGGVTRYYIADSSLTKTETVDVHATNNYGVYIVESAVGVSDSVSPESIGTKEAVDKDMSTWRPTYEHEKRPVMGWHFVKRSHINAESEVDADHSGSYKGMWKLFEQLPTSRDMIKLFDDTVDKYNKPLAEGLTDLEYAMNTIMQRSRMMDGSPADELVNVLREAYFCHVLVKEVRKEATSLSSVLPKYVMIMSSIARNVVEGRERFSADKMEGFGSSIWGAHFKLPRLIDAGQFGINAFSGMLNDAYNDAQASIKSNCEAYDELVRNVIKANGNLNDLVYQRPSSKYRKTRPFVFKSVNDKSLDNRPELKALLKFMEQFYRNTIPGFSTIGGTLAPLGDMTVAEAGKLYSKSLFWRSRFVHLFSNKPWDSELVNFSPSTGQVNGPNAQLRTLKEWKRYFLEQHTVPDLVTTGAIGTFFQHVAFRWSSYGTKSFSAFSTSKLHQLDREAREQYNSKYGNRKQHVDRSAMLRRMSVRRSGNGQSLIPTMNLEVSLRASIRDSINGAFMGKVTPVASYLYDELLPKDDRNKNDVAADFVFNNIMDIYPGARQKDDSPTARLIRASAWSMSMTYLGAALVPQSTNFIVGQANNFFTSGSRFAEGWRALGQSMINRDFGKVLRILRYYKVIDITEDFIFDEESNTLINKISRKAMMPMQFVENFNHAPLIIGFLGRRIFENLSSSMVNEMDKNGRDTGKPERGFLYKVNIPEDKAEAVMSILLANGVPKQDLERTVKLGFAWCADYDIKRIAATLNSSPNELKEGVLKRPNDQDLPSESDISYILGRIVGQTQGDYRTPLRNAFSHTTIGSSSLILRKWFPAMWSATVMSSKRDNSFELLSTIRDTLAADIWYYFVYGMSPYYTVTENGKSVKKRIGTKRERRVKYLHEAVSQMMKYSISDAKDFGLIDMDTKRAFKGRQLGTIMVLNQLKDMIMMSETADLSIEKFMGDSLNEEGQSQLDKLIVQLAHGGRKGDLMTQRSQNIIITNLISALIYFAAAAPDDDEKDAKGEVMMSQMPWYKRWLYTATQTVFMNGLAPFVMPEKISSTYTPSPLYNYYKRVFKGVYDNPYQSTLFEELAEDSNGQKRAKVADRVVMTTPFLNGLYANANLFYELATGKNARAMSEREATLMGRKLILLKVQEAYSRLKEEDPERFKRILDIQGRSKAASDAAMAVIWNRMKDGDSVDMNTFDYDMATENREQVMSSYENELKINNSKK